jgi:hypothetical protein
MIGFGIRFVDLTMSQRKKLFALLDHLKGSGDQPLARICA